MSLPWIKSDRRWIWEAACATHKPHQDQTVTQWAEAHIELPRGMTSAPGPFRTAMFPYMNEPMDAFHPKSGVRKMTLIWAAQSNKSTAIMLGIAYRLDRSPAPTLWVMDNSRNAQSFSESRWQRLIEANAVLAKHKPSDPDKFKNMEMHFNSMPLWFAGSNSPGNLASRSVGLLVMDEAGKYPAKARGEASSVQLAIQRTTSYPMHLIVITTTPVTPDEAAWQSYLESDQRRYFMPCPHCRELITFEQSMLKWDQSARQEDGSWDLKAVRNSARMECPKCAGVIRDGAKTVMLREGRWVATNDAAMPGNVGYHLNGFYSPRRTFGNLAVKFLQDKQSLMGLQDYVNSVLAEPWEDDGEKEQETPRTASDYLMGDRWDEADFSAMTIDVQDAGGRHFWVVIRDWSKDGRSRGRWAGRVETWDDLERIRAENEIRQPCVFVDSAFATREVYFMCCRFGWVSLRGSDNESFTWIDGGKRVQRAYAKPERGDPAGGGRWDAGTLPRRNCPVIKFSAPTCEDILAALRRTDPPRWEFPRDFPVDWHQHMASTVKKRVRNAATGAVSYKWVVPKGKDNHLRDCEKMQVVAALLAKVLTPAAERPKEKATP
jgi:hypothetical protein